MLEFAASSLLLGLTAYAIAAARSLWIQGGRASPQAEEERFVPVDGANMKWRAISEEADARWDSPPIARHEPILSDEEVEDDGRLRSIESILAREDSGSEGEAAA